MGYINIYFNTYDDKFNDFIIKSFFGSVTYAVFVLAHLKTFV